MITAGTAVRPTSVRLKIPAHWRRPPLYVPHPDSLLPIERCIWDLTPLNSLLPTKLRKCPRCGKFGIRTAPLVSDCLYVEECIQSFRRTK